MSGRGAPAAAGERPRVRRRRARCLFAGTASRQPRSMIAGTASSIRVGTTASLHLRLPRDCWWTTITITSYYLLFTMLLLLLILLLLLLLLLLARCLALRGIGRGARASRRAGTPACVPRVQLSVE